MYGVFNTGENNIRFNRTISIQTVKKAKDRSKLFKQCFSFCLYNRHSQVQSYFLQAAALRYQL